MYITHPKLSEGFFYSNPVLIELNDNNVPFILTGGHANPYTVKNLEQDEDLTLKKFSEFNIIKLIDNRPKVMLSINMIYGHGLPEGFGTILKFLEKDPKTFFVLDCPWIHVPENFYFSNNKNKIIDEANTPFNKFLFEFLDSKNVDYVIFGKDDSGNNKRPKVIANNIRVFQQMMPFYRNIRLIGKAVDYLRKPETEPYKRVYLSRRSWSGNRNSKLLYGDNDPAQYLTLGDFRIDDEKKVEEYLVGKGFEICYPEDFKDFRDQIRYFDLTKTLCTTTGSGMFNQIFMRPGGSIIELSNPMINNGIEMIHGHSQAIAWAMNHFHVSISHKKSADEIIDKLEKHENIFSMV